MDSDKVYNSARITNGVDFMDDPEELRKFVMDFLDDQEKNQVSRTVDKKQLASVFRLYSDAKNNIKWLDHNVLQAIFCAGMLYESQRKNEGLPLET
jgi:tryptophanyl-tRNA synthetase